MQHTLFIVVKKKRTQNIKKYKIHGLYCNLQAILKFGPDLRIDTKF